MFKVVILDDVRALPALELAHALDDLAIGPGWEYGDSVREASALNPAHPCLGEPAARRVEAFQNLVVGTMAERAIMVPPREQLSATGVRQTVTDDR